MFKHGLTMWGVRMMCRRQFLNAWELPMVALALLAAAGCSAPVKTATMSQLPANFSEAARLKRVVVLKFDTGGGNPRDRWSQPQSGGQDITPELEAQLAGVLINGQPHFTVVERARMNEALKEMRLAESGALDATTASRLGKMVAANGVYMGSVAQDGATDERYSERRSNCAQHKQEKDKKGRTYDGECQRWVDSQVGCVKRSATFAFTPRLVDVERGTIAYTKTISKTVSASGCSDQGQQLSSADEMLREARQQALQEFRQDIAPYSKRVEIALMNSTDGIVQPAAKDRFAGSLDFAKANRLDRACEIWRDLAASEGRSPALLYNRGACEEVGGNLEGALELYGRADRLLDKPDPTISAGLVRVRDAQAARAKAQGQLSR